MKKKIERHFLFVMAAIKPIILNAKHMMIIPDMNFSDNDGFPSNTISNKSMKVGRCSHIGCFQYIHACNISVTEMKATAALRGMQNKHVVLIFLFFLVDFTFCDIFATNDAVLTRKCFCGDHSIARHAPMYYICSYKILEHLSKKCMHRIENAPGAGLIYIMATLITEILKLIGIPRSARNL